MTNSKQTEDDLKSLYEKFRASLTKSQFKKFKTLKSNAKRILFVANLEEYLKYPVQAEFNCGKNIEEARTLKSKGNIEFKNENYTTALRLYSQAILKSSFESADEAEEAVVFYANRSASLYHLQEYELAIRDIDFALRKNYPIQLSYKLLDRKARCLLALKKHDLAADVFRLTIKALDASPLTTEKRQKWQKDIQIMLIMLKKYDSRAKPSSHSKRKSKKKLNNGPNPKYEAIKADIEIKFSEKMGRFAEAKSNIKTGDIVLIENAYCAVLLETYNRTHCHHCFRRIVILYPCQTCDRIVFCSEECADIASSTYHKVECPILGTLWKANVSITCFMALRMITQHAVNFFLDQKGHLLNIQPDNIIKHESFGYETVCALISHENERIAEDILNRIYMALYLTHCLQKTSYFRDTSTTAIAEKGSVRFNDVELFIAQLLLHHLQILQFNAHEVSELVTSAKNTTKPVSNFIGGAVYPTLALFNHSCNPGVVRYFHGTKVIARAIRNIPAGEMVAENYGPIFLTTAKIERQKILRERYWFTCECEACSHSWPTLTEMNESKMQLRCANTKCCGFVTVDPTNDKFFIKCRLCLENNNIMKILKTLQETDDMFSQAKNWMKSQNLEKALEEFLKILNLLDKTLVIPSKDYHICQDEIRICYLLMGNRAELKAQTK